MKSTSWMMVGLVACAVALAACLAMAEDWPQWRGPDRDAKATGFKVPQTWPKELTQKWKVPVGAGDSSPALVGDKLYVFGRQGNDEVLSCLDVNDKGKVLWSDKYEAQAVTGASARHPGPRSSPTVADGKVLTLGAAGVVSCWDTGGKLLWRRNDFPGVWPQYFTAASPLVVNGLCVLPLGGRGSGAIVAYDLADPNGKMKWKWTGDGPAYASPAVLSVDDTKLVVTMTEKNMVAVNAADGNLVWQAAFAPQGMAYNAPSPIIRGPVLIYTGQQRGMTAVKFEKKDGAITAKELWRNPDVSTQFDTPVLKDGMLFGLSAGSGGRGGGGGKFFCVDANSGKTDWMDATVRTGTFGSLVDGGPVILALTSDSRLFVLQPSEKAYTEVANYKVSEKETYAYPVVSSKGIFIRDQDSVALWAAE
jgi:outer membrane protein assembly factor BamB